jgi:hypothetical protein
MKSKLLRFLFAFAGGLLLAVSVSAQPAQPKVEFPAASPACTIKQRVGLTDIEVVYSRPGVKDRQVFGGIVPYGQIWRTGANAATKITFSTDVKLNGTSIPAGTYALFTIPGPDEWTIIINKDAKQWGAFQYKESDDVARFKTKPMELEEQIDAFTIEFNQIRDESAVMNLVWDRAVVPIHIDIELTSKLVPQIEAAMASPDKKPAGLYFQAATFYYDHDQDLHKALDWVNAGIEQKPPFNFELYHLKAQILAKQGDKAGAIAAAKESTNLATKAEGASSSFVKLNQDLISSLQ